MSASIWYPGLPIPAGRDFVSVKEYGAIGDGVTNDRAAIVAAFANHKNIFFPEGTYWMGEFSSSDRIIDLTTAGDDITINTGGNVELTCTSTTNVNPVFFYLRSNNRFKMQQMRFRDLNYSRTNSRGGIAITMDAAGADWGGVDVDAIYAFNCYSGIVIATKSTTRVRGVHIGVLSTIQCNRGYNGQDQGDNIVIDLLYAEQCERAVFIYGISGFHANVFVRNNYGTTGVVNISRAVGGYNTDDVCIKYIARENTVDIYHVMINHIDLLGGEISNIRVDVDIRGAVAYDAVRIVNYTGSGGSETGAASSNLVYDIDIKGSVDSNARPITVVAAYASKRSLKFTPGQYLALSNSVLAAFNLSSTVLSAPSALAWGAPTPPAIGTGTLTRNYAIVDGLCTVNYDLIADGSTTFGTGDWTFKLPAVSASNAQGMAYMLDSGTAYYVGVVRITTGSDTAKIYANAGATSVRSNTPFTWAAGDQLSFTLTYPIA